MAQANYVTFKRRIKNVERRHRKLSRGYVRLVERDGLLIPMRDRGVRHSFPFGGVLMILSVLFGFKAFLLTYLGPLTYADRVGKLADGGIGEQFGAWVMSADPVTTWIVSQVSVLF